MFTISCSLFAVHYSLSRNLSKKCRGDCAALTAIAHEAHKRKVGARGLMMILEEILLESMYHLPSEKKVKEIVVTREMIERKAPVFEVVPRSEEAA
ncbi:MAG: hypothetical protein ACKVQW_04590 [Pyrinomonadaceae bacterium]